MSAMKVCVVAVFSLSMVQAFPTPAKFQPLVDACDGKSTLSNCTADFQGVCQTSKEGVRWCGCDHHSWHAEAKSNFMMAMEKMKEEMGVDLQSDHDHSWPVHLGDCGSKNDGEVCIVPRVGQCIPSGKCPIFHGEMVCQPNDAHPPKFVTAPCEGKQAGDECEMMFISGKCVKPQYMKDMFCKVSLPFQALEQKEQNQVMVI